MMSQLLQFKTGNITNALTAPDHYWNGLGVESDGALAVDDISPINNIHQGLPVTLAGRVAIEFAAPVRFGNGATPFTANDRVACILSGSAVSFLAANGYDITGGLILE